MKETVEERFLWKKLIDSIISKRSGKSFKSGSKTATVIGVETNPQSGKTAFRLKDNSLVDCSLCRLETIITILGEFPKTLVTEAFTFYCNTEESDDNGNTFMFRNSPFELASNNYFATQACFESLANDKILWMSDEVKELLQDPDFQESIKYHKKTEYIVSDIEYDGEDVSDLPRELTVTVHHCDDFLTYEEIEQYVSDKISEETGFCHNGYTTNPEIKSLA